MEIKTENRGGSRRTVDPKKGKAKPYNVSLYEFEQKKLIKKYGSLTKAIRTLL